MKKLLLSSAAICGLAISAAPAQAQISLELGGFFKGYGFYTSQDDDVAENRNLDIVRSTEVHIGGETTLDNGLTVGYHSEMDSDGDDGFEVQESYAYFSGSWGRVNFGAEDGASYLLQVAAPSADSNLDGIRQFVNPMNYNGSIGGTSDVLDVTGTRGGLDYDQDVTGYTDKLTYLSPIMNGFQVGVSYTPDTADVSDEDAENEDDVDDAFGSAYEASARYEGNFNNVGVIAGAGYTRVVVEGDEVANEDRDAWNVGLDLDIGAFGVGAAYLEDDFGTDDDEEETIVVGADYTTGPFKFGASYINIDNVVGVADDEAERYTGGVTYTYGPGMTLMGSVSHVQLDDMAAGGDDADGTSLLVGTQLNF